MIQLEQDLRQWRREEANRRQIPPYIVLRDDTISQIVEKKPTTEGELSTLKGVGKITMTVYGQAILDLVRAKEFGISGVIRIENIDLDLLQKQRAILAEMSGLTAHGQDAIDGVLNLLDYIWDRATD